MATTRDPSDDIFDEESYVNFGDKEWNRLKESLTKVHIYQMISTISVAEAKFTWMVLVD